MMMMVTMCAHTKNGCLQDKVTSAGASEGSSGRAWSSRMGIEAAAERQRRA